MTSRTTNPKEDGRASVEAEALRCRCGSLVARVIAGGVELKCRRCRRRLLVKLGAAGVVTISGDLAERAG
jgi:DNA-directed RNA polymerase subunit RPC12/RpoP